MFALETVFKSAQAEVVVTQPRLPCFKLNLKFDRDDMIKRFLASHFSGFYLRVLREGEVGAGDEIIPCIGTRTVLPCWTLCASICVNRIRKNCSTARFRWNIFPHPGARNSANGLSSAGFSLRGLVLARSKTHRLKPTPHEREKTSRRKNED